MSPPPHIEVTIDLETGCAIASITPAADESALDAEAVANACKAAGVAVTDDVRARVAKVVAGWNAKPQAARCKIASPIAPINGKDGFVDWCEGFDPTIRPTDAESEDRVDHYAGQSFIRVDPGTRVGTLHGPEPGTDGTDVAGKPIKAKPGAPCPLRIDSTLNVDDDGTITSEAEGVLKIKAGTVCVTKLLEVSEHVDFSTGHIDFDGCVDIREEVRDLFQIKATGSVSVGGLIEAATIECGGDFSGRRGMAGKGRGMLRVQGDAEIGFLNDTNAAVGGTLMVRREIINCALLVEGALAAEACTVIGGTLDLRGRGTIGALGTGSHRPTLVMLGKDANLLILKMLHPKVSFRLGQTIYEVDQPTKGPVRIVASAEHSLAYRIADGSPRPISEIARALRAAA